MPVMVIGAETALGEAVVRRLLRTGGQVRVYLDPDEDELIEEHRAMGCFVARGETDDEGRLEAALTQVHTVLHAADSLLDEPRELLDRLAWVAEAAVGANVRRIVWPSWIGAGSPDGDEWSGACAEAEELLAGLPFESVVVRRSLTYGPGDALTMALASAPVDSDARHAPLWRGDLAEALVEADRQRGGEPVTQVLVELAGPQPLPVRDVCAGLRDRLTGLRGIALPEHARAYLSRDALPGADALGSSGTPFERGLDLLA